MGLRIKGQEVTVNISKAGNLQSAITKISNFEMEIKLEMKEEGFLGATTNEYDEIFNGVTFGFEMHLDNGDWFGLQQSIIDKARRVTPDVQYSIIGTMTWPSGESKAVIIPDAHFEAVPINVGSRSDYVTVKCSGGASEYTVQDLI